MGKAEDAVRRSGKLQSGESILGSNSVILTVAPNKQKGGFIVQTDKAIYFCVQGGLGLGKVKEVHRLDVDKVMARRARESALSRGGMDVMLLAPRGDLSIGSPAPPEAAQELGDVRMVAVSFRTYSDFADWSRLRGLAADKSPAPRSETGRHEKRTDTSESQLVGTSEVRQLQEQYANRVSFGAQMISEINEIDEIYGRLRDLGADADPNLVEREKQRNADWMRENPWLDYYEPHLDRERFDAERQERIRKEQAPVTNPIPNDPPITAGDPVDRYTGRQFFDAFRHSIRELDIRQTSRYAVSDWYSDLVNAGQKGYVSILLDPSDTHENLADELSEWLMGTPASESNFYVDELKEELDAWVDFDPPPLRG